MFPVPVSTSAAMWADHSNTDDISSAASGAHVQSPSAGVAATAGAPRHRVPGQSYTGSINGQSQDVQAFLQSDEGATALASMQEQLRELEMKLALPPKELLALRLKWKPLLEAPHPANPEQQARQAALLGHGKRALGAALLLLPEMNPKRRSISLNELRQALNKPGADLAACLNHFWTKLRINHSYPENQPGIAGCLGRAQVTALQECIAPYHANPQHPCASTSPAVLVHQLALYFGIMPRDSGAPRNFPPIPPFSPDELARIASDVDSKELIYAMQILASPHEAARLT